MHLDTRIFVLLSRTEYVTLMSGKIFPDAGNPHKTLIKINAVWSETGGVMQRDATWSYCCYLKVDCFLITYLYSKCLKYHQQLHLLIKERSVFYVFVQLHLILQDKITPVIVYITFMIFIFYHNNGLLSIYYHYIIWHVVFCAQIVS